jgi:hypothetical protein
MARARSQDFKTPLCRLSFAQGLYKISEKTNKYGCTLIFPKADRKILEPYVAQVIKEEWKEPGLERARKGLIKSPFLVDTGDGKSPARNKQTGELHPGMGPDVFFIRCIANKDRAPWVRWKDPNLQMTEADVYSGCWVKAVIGCFTWHNDQSGDGVSFGITGLQKIKDGERLGSGGPADPSEYLETIEDTGDAPESTRQGGGAGSLFGED